MSARSEAPGSDDGGRGLALRCRGLVKRFADLTAVAGIDLAIYRGECFGLLGPNGAGKTTTVEMLEGLQPADEGTVELLGERWGAGRDHQLRCRIGVQLQDTQLADKLTVEETVRLFRSFYPDLRGRPVDEVIDILGLEPKRRARVHKLSGGQQQRLALACALVSEPEVLFLDEPTTGLDPQARLRIWEVIEGFRQRGGTVLLTTHYMEEAARLCDRVAIMDHGEIIALDTPQRLVAELQADQIVECSFAGSGSLAAEQLGSLPAVRSVTPRNGKHLLAVADIGLTLPALLALIEGAGLRLEVLTTRQATLEDVFVSRTGRGLREE